MHHQCCKSCRAIFVHTFAFLRPPHVLQTAAYLCQALFCHCHRHQHAAEWYDIFKGYQHRSSFKHRQVPQHRPTMACSGDAHCAADLAALSYDADSCIMTTKPPCYADCMMIVAILGPCCVLPNHEWCHIWHMPASNSRPTAAGTGICGQNTSQLLPQPCPSTLALCPAVART